MRLVLDGSRSIGEGSPTVDNPLNLFFFLDFGKMFDWSSNQGGRLKISKS